MITLEKARAMLPSEEQQISDQDLSSLLSQCYELADLVIDIYLERKRENTT